MSEDEYEADIERIEFSDLPVDLIARATDAMGFTKAFHDFMRDWKMVSNEDVDTAKLEAAFEAFVAEHQAACIFLASFQGTEDKLLNTYKALNESKDEGVPELVINGYKKLAERVVRTRASFTAPEE
jgi:hypothetical protein